MASINGVTIKSFKTFRGHEWEECSQGNVYLNGKKLGFWSQDSYGGPDTYEFDEDVLKKACSDFKDGFPRDYRYLDVCDDIDVFMGELTRLITEEKHLKKFFNKGYKVAIIVSNGYYSTTLATVDDCNNTALLTKYAKDIEEMKADIKGDAEVYIFRPNDFDLIVDSTHEVPTYLMSK